MTFRNNHSYCHDAESWGHGPVLEVTLRLRAAALDTIAVSGAQGIMASLHIDGPYVAPDDIGISGREVRDWRKHDSTCGLWHLSASDCLGVRIMPDKRAAAEFSLAIPPRHVHLAFGGYPWVTTGQWVTPNIVRLHELIIARVREMHRAAPIEAAAILDETWTYGLRNGVTGIIVMNDVARAGAFEGEPLGFFFRIDL